MDGSLSFRTHLSFAIIEASIWTSQTLTLLEKLQSARFWDITDGAKRDEYCWTESGVERILAIKDLGIIKDGENAIIRCQLCEY